MADKKKRLSKGLDAIFDTTSTGGDLQSMISAIESNSNEFTQEKVSIDLIRPNPYQPRKHFDQDKLNELAQSIKEHGILQPILLKKSIHGYDIVAGERRFRGANIAGLKEVPAIIVDFTDDQMMEIALLENIQREDLNAIEEAQAYKAMMDKMNLTQEELAGRIGKSRTHVTNTLRLLNINEKLQQYILEGILSMGHVRPLVGLDDETALKIANRAIKEKLSVRQVEDIVRGYKLAQKRKNAPKKEKNTTYTYAEDLLRKKFRTKVKVEEKTITLKDRRWLAIKKIVDEDDDFDPEVNCIVLSRPDDKLREQMQIIQDNAQRDMTSEDKKNLFQKLNDIFDTAEAEGNYAVTGGQTKSDWISVNLGVSQRTVQRWLKEIQSKKESPEEEKPVAKSDDKPSKSATPEDPDAPGKEDIAQAKDILSSKFASVNVTKGKITFKFETKDDLAELVEMLTGIEMAV